MFGKSSNKMETVVGPDSTLKGEIATRGTVRIDGSVEGDIRADWVIIGESGTIRGNIRSRGVVVGGRVEGNIDSEEIVELKDKAQVSGEIAAAKLTMSEGAMFDGRSSMKTRKEASAAQEGKVKSLAASRTAS